MSIVLQKQHTHRVARAGHRKVAAVAALALAGLVGGCATQAPAPQGAATSAAPASEDAVRALAAARWQALIEGDFAKAYASAAPSFRGINTLEAYRSNKQGVSVKWLSASVLNVSCEASVCAVKIELESKPITPFPFKGTLKSALDERWVLEEGKWWIFEKL